jgi:hypothetical protein
MVDVTSASSVSFAGRLQRRMGVTVRLLQAALCSSTNVTLRNDLLGRLIEHEEYSRLIACMASPAISTMEAGGSTPFPLLVTTNKGLFVLHDGRWHCLLPVACFGIARHEDGLYLGVSAGIYSLVLKARISGLPGSPLAAIHPLIRYETRYHNERIHQIAYDPATRHVLCANSRRNSLLAVDSDNGQIVDEKFLFVDGTGFPVYTDQNHVNSVAPHGDSLLFSAHSAGENFGVLGFVADDHVRAYRYQARGVHDVVIHEGGIMFTDTFRDALAATNPEASGAIRYRGGDYLIDATDIATRQRVALRGLALRDANVAVGFSAFGSRESRQAVGAGGVIVARPDGSGTAIEGPFSQVYDILPFDGVRTDRPGPIYSVDELDTMFRRDVGPLLYEAPVARSARLAQLR